MKGDRFRRCGLGGLYEKDIVCRGKERGALGKLTEEVLGREGTALGLGILEPLSAVEKRM